MKLSKSILVGLTAVAVVGAVAVSQAGNGKSCCASKATASVSADDASSEAGTVVPVSNTSCSSKKNASNASCSSGVKNASNASCSSSVKNASNTSCSSSVKTASNTSCSSGVKKASNTSCSSGVKTASNADCASGAKSAAYAHCASGAKNASNSSCCASGAKTTTAGWTLPDGMNYTKVNVPGGVDYVFTGQGIDQLGEMCQVSCSKTAAKSGSKFSHSSGAGYVVLSVRGETTGSCCDDVVQTALMTSGVVARQS